MRILFICGSLEPGRDGVGDYTRKLCGALHQQGVEIAAVALKDNQINDIFEGTQLSDGSAFPVLRLPSVWSANRRFNYVERWIQKVDPDWISLQYVSYSYQKNGLPFGLNRRLARIGKGRQWHIMFHEIWVGINLESSTKHIWWGRVQRWLIKSIFKSLKPAVIHTQTQVYQEELRALGIATNYLPLFSNISLAAPAETSTCADQLAKKDQKKITLVIFGAIHPGGLVETFAKEVASFAREHNLPARLMIVGRCGEEQEKWSGVFKSAGIAVNLLGEQPPERVSEVLHSATLGLTTTPLHLVEKSGTVAAMRDHSLPIICVSKPWRPRASSLLKLPADVMEYQPGNFPDFTTISTDSPGSIKVSDVSHNLKEALLKKTKTHKVFNSIINSYTVNYV